MNYSPLRFFNIYRRISFIDLNITNNIIGPLNWRGIYIESSTDNKINYNNIFKNNNAGILLLSTLGNQIHNNNIEDNSDYGLMGLVCFDSARFNWWGHYPAGILFGDLLVGGIVPTFPCLKQSVDIPAS